MASPTICWAATPGMDLVVLASIGPTQCALPGLNLASVSAKFALSFVLVPDPSFLGQKNLNTPISRDPTFRSAAAGIRNHNYASIPVDTTASDETFFQAVNSNDANCIENMFVRLRLECHGQ
jgi:hypothetical protein